MRNLPDREGNAPPVSATGRWWGWRLAALAWVLVVGAVGWHQVGFWRAAKLNTDAMALLPQDEQFAASRLATQRMVQSASGMVVVLAGAPDWDMARRAANAARAALAKHADVLKVESPASVADSRAAIDSIAPWRDRLLTPQQRVWLAETPQERMVERALARLHQPGPGSSVSGWASDPLGLSEQWWIERASQTRARPRDGELWLRSGQIDWIVITARSRGQVFSLDGEPRLALALDAARGAATQAIAGSRVVATGLPLHAEAAAVQASREVNTIGWGSLAAILVLVWLAFRSFSPIFMVTLTLVVGTATAITVTDLVFGEVHLLTLVFGASLVGVAEDYGIHYFSSRQADPGIAPMSLLRRLLPGLCLALLTSVIAYLALGLAPLPGLRQMAVFSAVGLTAAFLTGVCWFPWLDRSAIAPTRFSGWLGASLALWPRLKRSRSTFVLAMGGLLVVVPGLSMLEMRDDIRQMQNSPAPLVKAQLEINRLLGLPSVAQFFVVTGQSEQQVLEREESLKSRLDAWVGSARIGGYQAVSDWVPSAARQTADAQLVKKAESAVVREINHRLGESLPVPLHAPGPLVLSEWMGMPGSAVARSLWLGDSAGGMASMVTLRGLADPALLPGLKALADEAQGVHWVDKADEASALLERYRRGMGVLLVMGHALVLGALWLRYRRQAWRAWVPTALASLLTVGVMGWTGQPLQLFNVLALTLLLGIGADYGIFLLEHPGDGSAWLAVQLGAASTWLAFGLLALSTTPALRAFGLTLMIGIALVWVLAPLMRPEPGTKGDAA
ncbi:MAG: MMPL family transporter [Ramlibacter sp.]|jgi:predicted exporter|nr:MMPL family transporter [Ramlibacter sp.]